MDISAHPCFNDKVRHLFGRIHLPVAPRCNIQCKFCNRKFDCINESRPGVTSAILSPYQALVYLDEMIKLKKNISVVGIAGPGDPFANPDETIETLMEVRNNFADMMLCVASNGLNITPYLDDLAKIKVSHVTITVNAIDLKIASKIYSWVRYGKKVLKADEGVKILLKNQIEAITELKKIGIIVKVNTIIIPGINDEHIQDIAQKMAELKVDILNCVPYYPNKGDSFENIEEPSKEMIANVRSKAGKFLHQMHHCTRCRADAVGLLGEEPDKKIMNKLQECEKLTINKNETTKINEKNRPYIAVASMEGALVNLHLGEAHQLFIYKKEHENIVLIEKRPMPEPGTGLKRWEQISSVISDCNSLLVSGIGHTPKNVISNSGVNILVIEGIIEEAAKGIFEGKNINYMMKRQTKPCGTGCSGGGMGCD
ncbi:MAG: nitrogenase cofactor biosynthesis protein NifB [Desulfobacterales bacterium]|nr:nitrogenase cofactor biosynthesis protein NifB [Desulfobacterales bacterium]